MKRQLLRFFPTALAVTVACASTPYAFAATILNDGSFHVVNSASDDLIVQNDGANATVLSVVPGADVAAFDDMDDMVDLPEEGRSIAVFDTSVLIFSGGVVQGRIETSGSSASVLVGTALANDDVIVSENATMQISSNAVIGGALDISGTAQVDFIAGEVDDLLIAGDASVDITAGFIDDDLIAEGNAVVTMAPSGRVDDDAFFEGSSRLETTGGQFDDELQFYDTSTGYFNGGVVNDDLVVADDASVVIDNFQVDDTIEAEGSSTTIINGGVFANVEAAGDSVVTINGGSFSPEGGVTGAFGGLVTVNGGEFGTAGGTEPVELAAVQGVLDFSGATIAGSGDDTAPTTEVDASIGGLADLSGVAFGDLSVQAATGALIDLTDTTADAVSVNLEASNAIIDMSSADELNLTAQLGSNAIIRGGDYDSGVVQSLSGSLVEIRGFDFFVNGIEVAAVPALFVDGSIPFANGVVTGFLTDHQPFEFTFARGFTAGTQIVLVQAPEPSTMMLSVLGLIGLTGRARRRR